MRRLYLKIYLTIIASPGAGAGDRRRHLAVRRRRPAGDAGVRDRGRTGERLAAAGERAAIRPAAGVIATWRIASRPISRCSPRAASPIARARPAVAAAAAGRRGRAGCTAPAGRRGASGCRTAAGSSPARRCGIGIPRSVSSCFSAASSLAVAIGAYPIVRGLTRRLERLQAGVETLGAGNLSARVKVEGKDEVARLAGSFNRAAARIEELVGAHRMLLANASHELRTPLSRIRLGIELFEQSKDPKYKAAIEQRHRRTRLHDRRNPAGQPARGDAAAAGRGERRSAGARGRGRRALRQLLGRGRGGDGARRAAAAQPAGPQPDRERGAPRRAAGDVRGAARLQHGRAGGDGCRRRHSGGRARAGVLAVPSPAAATRRARVSASRWCGRSRGCTAATRWSRRAAISAELLPGHAAAGD